MTGSVLFRCAEQPLALPLPSVSEVFRMVAVAARLPRAARYALGVVDLRGALLPLVDLSARLGLSAARDERALADGHVLVVHDGMGLVGYAVDQVTELSDAPVEPLGAARHALGAFIRGAVRLADGALVPVLQPSLLLTARARYDLQAALTQLAPEARR